MSTADACAREAAWLSTTTDSLPYLPAAAGGPFQVIQAYWPRTPQTQKTQLYVLRRSIPYAHPASQRYRPQYEFTLKVVWPVKTSQVPLAETEQQNLDNAVELLLERIAGPVGDKTHGGRFLSVGEVPREQPMAVDFDDPEVTIAAEAALRATLAYRADDYETTG